MTAPTRPFDPRAPLALGVTLLEASAGTGKTYAITSFILRFVLERGCPIDRILAVTFTNAATDELQARIRARLETAREVFEALAEDRPLPRPDDLIASLVGLPDSPVPRETARTLADRARRALDHLDRSHITTLHGFCQQVLQQHALEVGLPFDLAHVEGEDAIIAELADDLWARLIGEREPAELRLLQLGGVDLETFRNLVILASEPAAAPTPRYPPAPPPDATALLNALNDARRHAEARDVAATLRTFIGERRRPTEYQLSFALTALEHLSRGSPCAKDLADLGVLHHRELAPEVPDHALPPVIVALTALLDAHGSWLMEAIPWLTSERLRIVDTTRAELVRRADLRRAYTHDALLARLADALREEARQGLDTLARRVGDRFDAVLIDEFQDTDPTQWEIFERLFGRRTHHLILIGDPKQAIYGFRRADLRTYLTARERAEQIFTLTQNRRSDARLVDALNRLFLRDEPERVEAFAMPRVAYHRVESTLGDRLLRGPAPIRLAWLMRADARSAKGASPRGLPKAWGEAQLPGLVARDIVATLRSERRILEGDASRPLMPSDLAVLVTTNRQAEAIHEALEALGIPAAVHGSTSLFDTEAARDLVSVLRAILEPTRLTLVRRALVTRTFGARLDVLADADEAALEPHLRTFRTLRERWLRDGFGLAYRAMLRPLLAPLLAHADGDRHYSTLRQLCERLELETARHDHPPAALLRWLERQVTRPDLRTADEVARLTTDEPAVQIATIHKAKGLEYPIVYCPYLWQGSPQRPPAASSPFISRDDRGHHLVLDVDPFGHERLHHLRLLRYEQCAERLRGLYVALTRARHELVIYGGLFWDLHESALGSLLFGARMAQDPTSLEAEMMRLKDLGRDSDDTILARLRQRLGAPLFDVEPVNPKRSEAPWARPLEERPLACRHETRRTPLDLDWRRTSFSGLVAELHDESAAADEPSTTDLQTEPPIDAPPVPLAHLPSGRAFGNLLHKIFELFDFQDISGTSLSPIVARELARAALDPALAPPLETAILRTLATPLDATGFRLNELPRGSRLTELGFVFPVETTFTQRALIDLYRAHAPPDLAPWVERLSSSEFRDLRGFLSGSLDLAFVHPRDNRWYILDWKSNHLGPTAAHYDRGHMLEAMSTHHYHLQHHLYAVALSRHLRHRLGPRFLPERDLGGVFYLFVRGVDPDHPPGAGVFHVPPSPSHQALVAALDARMKAGVPT